MPIQVSIVVPTYRRTELLSRCLAALAVQDYDPTAYEVVVADDGADDETCELVECWAAYACRERGGPQISYLPVSGAHGPAAARNRGWHAARGAVVAFTDDDTIPAPDWLRSGVSVFRPGVAAAAGQVVVPMPDEPTDYERNASGLETAEFITANCFCRRGALEAGGGFDERFTMAWREDSDLFLTLLSKGGEVVFAPDAVVVHPIRQAEWGVSLKQQKRNLFNALLYKKHPDRYARWVQISPRGRYYSIVGALALGLGLSVSGPRLLAPL
ncbi:MAG: glycosyltransferase family 2 protein, partial [Rudaea sp.]